MRKEQKLEIKLQKLIQALKQEKLWQTEPPSTSAFSSKEPFCVDTMALEVWLQWIFIPRINEIIKKNQLHLIQHQSDIHSMAEYSFKQYPENTQLICQIIQEIDQLLNQSS